jgi:Holliday junction resolvase RusA-like endonuclease
MRADFFTRKRGGQDRDWDNLGKLVSDAGNGVLYVDDAQVVDPYCPVYRLLPTDGRKPGTNLLVWRL